MAETIVPGFNILHTAAGDGAAGTARYSIRKIIWSGYSTAAHTIVVKDGAGNIVIPAIACGGTSGPPIIFNFEDKPLILTGVETDVLGSGTVTYLLA
jgi:hypothetical protein